MGIKYLCESWQGLIQMVVYLVSQGYYYYYITRLPEKKRDKWVEIDLKLIAKYQADKSKWQRTRQKGKGLACFYYLRWEEIAIIMHTRGEIKEGIDYTDNFEDIKKKNMRLHISELAIFDICSELKSATVKMAPKMYRGVKDSLAAIAKPKDIWKIKQEFERLNGIPGYRGVLRQKYQLAKHLIKQAAKHQVKLSMTQLRFYDKRKTVKVWKE